MPWGGGGKRLFYYEEKEKNRPRWAAGQGSCLLLFQLPLFQAVTQDRVSGRGAEGPGTRGAGILHAAHPRGCRLVG